MLSPGGEPVSEGKARTHRSYKVAELMGVEPISAGLWMPWVLHKVNTLLAALPLTEGWEDKVLTMEKQLMNFLISNNTWKYLEMLSSSSQQLSSFTTRCLALVTKGTYP